MVNNETDVDCPTCCPVNYSSLQRGGRGRVKKKEIGGPNDYYSN